MYDPPLVSSLPSFMSLRLAQSLARQQQESKKVSGELRPNPLEYFDQHP